MTEKADGRRTRDARDGFTVGSATVMPVFSLSAFRCGRPRSVFGRLVGALSAHGVTLLVDCRLNAASSQLTLGTYGPKDWTLQAKKGGSAGGNRGARRARGHSVPLGPRARQPAAQRSRLVILHEHLKDEHTRWPVQRGLRLLADLLGTERAVALLCTCDRFANCHVALLVAALIAANRGLEHVRIRRRS